MKRAVTLALAASLALAIPASAEVVGKEGGLTYVKKVKTLPGGGGPAGAEAVANCPGDVGDMVHTGGGASVTGDTAGTTLSTVGIGDDWSWYASGWHTGINDENEKLTTWVICTSKVATMFNDTETVPVAAGPTSGNTTTACEDGVVTGGGARLIGASQDWWLNASFPVDLTDPDPFTNNGWRAFAHHLSGTAASTMLVDVVCLTGKEPSYPVRSTTTDDDVVTLKTSCPNDRAVTGGGAFASGASDDAYIVATAPFDSKSDKGKVPDDGWKARIRNNTSGEQTFNATAICR